MRVGFRGCGELQQELLNSSALAEYFEEHEAEKVRVLWLKCGLRVWGLSREGEGSGV